MTSRRAIDPHPASAPPGVASRRGLMTTDPELIIKQAMSILGKRTSPAKAAASKANGTKGGRPRKAAKPARHK